MCGIAGIFAKKGQLPIVRLLADMIGAEQHRGVDSTGFAFYGSPASHYVLRLHCAEGAGASQHKAVLDGLKSLAGPSVGIAETDLEDAAEGVNSSFMRVIVEGDEESVREFARSLPSLVGATVHSLGRSMEVVKDEGIASDIIARHGLAGFLGTHGIAHCRLATESRVDVTHSHPFWGIARPDLTVVHNGQLTNYHRLRRQLEGDGHRFLTSNDSELIAVWVAKRMDEGAELGEALEESVRILDGTFTYLIATEDGIGMAKDRLAAKPLIVGETETAVCMASEARAVAAALGHTFDSYEPDENVVNTWSLSTRTV